MRLDLTQGGDAPALMRLGLRLFKWYAGIVPGPMLTVGFRRYLMKAPFRTYVLRGEANGGPWTRGDRELFAAYVSNINTCHF